ncbi:protocadherin gamma-A4-like isoform X1 [Haliotis cracherodii]|uniref:protocadherin gamma-A4-like isoform X1 n=1 Tax=Haliotis cracherodii TaxID=6455 RepID=UPI0039E81CFD
MNEMTFTQGMAMDVSLRMMLWMLLALSVTSAVDVYDVCLPLPDKITEIFVDVQESASVGSVVKKMQYNGTHDEIRVTAIPNTYFDYNDTSQEIILIKKLDADGGNERELFSMRCQLATSPLPTVAITVHMLIKDVNDHPPVFDEDNYYINVSETMPNGSVIPTPVAATDRDADKNSNGRIYYSIPEMYSSYFEIKNPLRTALTLISPLDYETNPNMTIHVTAMDQPTGGATQMTATTTLHINVVDMDDLPPAFDEPSYTGIVPELSPKGRVVNVTKAISARDQDVTINAPLRYSIKKATNDYFQIDSNTAVVSVNNPPPAQEFSIMIEATQIDNSFRTDTTFLKIVVSAINSKPPTFQQPAYTASVPESLPLGSTIVTVTATDTDFGSRLLYLFAKEEDVFTINDVSGVIKLRQALDYERETEYSIPVVATDGQFNTTATVTVYVSDVNDNNPVFTQKEITVDRERVQDELITKVEAVDYDYNTVLSYSLASHASLFAINAQGELRISANQDNLTENQYDVVVIVTDNGVPSRQSSAVVKVKFPPLNPTIGNVTMQEAGSDVVSICLGVVAATLLIIVIILAVYIVRRLSLFRRLQSTEQLDKAKNRSSLDPRGIMFKKHPGSRAPSRVAIDFSNEESTDGGTTLAENPFTLDGNSNYGYIHSDESENDRDVDEIQIETAVIPYRNVGKFPSNAAVFPNMEDEDGLPINELSHSYQNSSLSTFKDSNDSLHSDSTSSKKGLMKSMNGIGTKSLPNKKLSWAGNGEMPSNKSLNSLDHDPGISPIDEKPEITVYF